MKSILLLIVFFSFSISAWSQAKPVKVVFDLTSKDTSIHRTTMRHIKAMSAAYPESEFEVVIYSGALPMVLKDQSSVANDLTSFQDNERVTFKVCAISMKRNNVGRSGLLPGVDIVQDGILEIVYKQNEGWGYIKEAN